MQEESGEDWENARREEENETEPQEAMAKLECSHVEEVVLKVRMSCLLVQGIVTMSNQKMLQS